jgi:hypothetical protein
MEVTTTKKRIIKLTDSEIRRLNAICSKLHRGDKKRIAELAGVHPVWVSYVLSGEGVSEPVLKVAEHLIREREQQAN